MNQDKPFVAQDTKIVYGNPWIKVREDVITKKDGHEGIYAYLEVNQSVCIVAVNDEGKICLVESYRHIFGDWFWELPGGGSDGTDIVLAAQRELLEETGITAGEWTQLGKARVCNGLSNEYQKNLLATDITYGNFAQTEEETRDRKFVSLDEIDAMIRNGELEDNQSMSALYMYKSWLENHHDHSIV